MIKKMFLSILLALGISSANAKTSSEHPFQSFLGSFIPRVSDKAAQLNKAFWLLETTGSSDAADLVASLSTELSLMFNNAKTYQDLLKWSRDSSLKDPLLKRQLQTLIYSFKANAISEELLKELALQEASLALSYANFRATLHGKAISENEILEVLKTEKDPNARKEAWEASKEIGMVLSPKIIEIVKLRNQAAKSLGYDNYFLMQLDLQEVNEQELFTLLDQIALRSDAAYQKTLKYIEEVQSKEFSTPINELGPWAWNDPFSQEDPIDKSELDSLVANTDLVEAGRSFYKSMGINVDTILKQSDMYERNGKNQHAFCINMDRGSDIRTLNNVKPTLRWFDTVLHELGHAIYELGYDSKLPWQLREPPHMITTEAMALMAGRRAHLASCLSQLPTYSSSQDDLIKKAEESMQRRQLIFSRWVLVMTYFERELYKNPEQDLNRLWWDTVAKYQKITPPKNREGKNDWAAKYHMGLAPVYYYSYLLGEVFASSMEEAILKVTGSNDLNTQAAGKFLQEKLFGPGNSMNWSDLIQNVLGKPLSIDAWITQFTKESSDLGTEK
jgi:peptidyl-dipeptidase A